MQIDIFWSKVDRSGGPDACWQWLGFRDRIGYGHFSHKLAHRIAWIARFGGIPEGQQVLHHCDNPPCCNSRHLFLGTQADNMRDCVAKGRLHSANARKTHCPFGHPYDEENTYIVAATGWRICKACNRARAKRRRRAAA